MAAFGVPEMAPVEVLRLRTRGERGADAERSNCSGNGRDLCCDGNPNSSRDRGLRIEQARRRRARSNAAAGSSTTPHHQSQARGRQGSN